MNVNPLACSAPRPDAGLRRRRCGTQAPGLIFNAGGVSITDGAWSALRRFELEAADLVRRHCMADWSHMMPHDRQANLDALRNGGRIFSSFQLGPDVRVWVITEADRSSTSIVLPGEF